MPTAKKSAATTTAPKINDPKAAPTSKASATKTATRTKKTATRTTKTASHTSAAPVPVTAEPAKIPAKKAASASAKTEVKKTSAKPKVTSVDLPCLKGEQPWTAEEIAEVREELEADFERMSTSISKAEAELAELLQEGRDGAGLDPVDVGSSNFERDQEMSLTANMRETLEQTERALERLNTGKYGACENCGEPIGKGRLLAFPRATMCVTCKTREERR